jgi:hypothetical protein
MSKMTFLMPMKSMIGKIRYLGLLIASLTILFSGCKKNTTVDLRPNLNAANDNVILHRAFIHVFDMMLKASLDSVLHADLFALIDSAAVTYNPQLNRYTFDYQGNKCPDSVIRYGTFEIVSDTGFFITGAKASVNFTSYFEDGHFIQARDTIRNQGIITGGKIHFQSDVDSALIAKESSGNIHWKGSLNHHVDPSIVTQGVAGAVVLVDGSGSGISSGGYGFSSVIHQPVKDMLDCPWLRSGVVGFSIPGAEVGNGTITYWSDATCNDSVHYNFDGTIYKWRMDRDHLSN